MASASQLTNTLGAQVVFDGETPRTFTGKATEVVSGGFLVTVSGATGDVSSGVSSFVTEDLNIIGAQDVTLCNGIALNTAASGTVLTIAQRGAYLGLCAKDITAGQELSHNASGAFVPTTLNAASGTVAISMTSIARAMTTAASGTASYVLAYLNV